MNILSIISLLIALGVFFTAVLTSTDDPMKLVDFHGFLIVIGGSIGATAIGYSIDRVGLMLKVFWMRTLKSRKLKPRSLILEMMRLSEIYRSSPTDLKSKVDQITDNFLKEAMQLLLDNIVDEKQLNGILKRRVNTIYNRYREESSAFGAMGKYPPAMGLMGAVLGMIALLAGLGQPGAEKTVGPALSIALIATFYGIALANLVVIPISENLSEGAKQIKNKNNMIIEGVKLIGRKTNPIVLAEELNSFLLPSERIDLKEFKS